jgi:hypothetical protein
MGTMPVFSVHGCHGEARQGDCVRSYFTDSMLPVFYMMDYSILGLLVDDLPKALDVLSEKGFLVSAKPNVTVSLVESSRLKEIVGLLEQQEIGSEVADIVNEVYQG